MDKKDMLKKEISDLEIEAKTARNKNLDANRETANIHKQKVTLIGEIAVLEREKKELFPVVDKLKSRAKEANDKIKQDKLGVARDRAKVSQDIAYNKDEANKNEDTRIELEREQNKLKSDKLQFKESKRKVSEREAEAQRKFNDSKKSQELYEAGVRDNDKERKDLEKEKEGLQAQKDEVSKNLDEAKRLKAVYEDKIREVGEEKEKTKIAMQLVEDKENAVAKRNDELNKGEIGLKIDQDAVIQKNKSLDAAYAALETREDEFEIKVLRLEKAVKEKTVKTELAKLRKDAGK